MMISSQQIMMTSPQQMIGEVWNEYHFYETELKGVMHVAVGVSIAAYGVFWRIKSRDLDDDGAFSLNQAILYGLDTTLYGLIELALPITCHTIYKIVRSWSQISLT